jgi:methylated-DNA-[protein]-cysteine S-methyltransferase
MSLATVSLTTVASSFGEVSLVWREDESGPMVVEILLPNRRTRLQQTRAHPFPPKSIEHLCEAMHDYLEGKRIELPTHLLDWGRCSSFQRSVLVAERTIPRGYVSSYSALATHVGKPKAARAAGTALARNPFPIIIPCHRTVRTDGSLGGFGGGLPMKRALLEMEGVAFDRLGRVRKEFFWDLSTGSTT